MKTIANKGPVSEIEVFNFAKKSEDKLKMATFWFGLLTRVAFKN